jgi:glycosyltransferase involved in cell wall biosynthesis
VARLPQSLGAKLMIVGEGNLRDELLALARQEGVEDRLILPGYAADVWPFYASADLFALPSREESFGLVLVEALYAGLPIVSTATIGAADVLQGGQWGRLVPQGDVGAFAVAMEAELGSAPDGRARRKWAEQLSGKAAVDAYVSLLDPDGP